MLILWEYCFLMKWLRGGGDVSAKLYSRHCEARSNLYTIQSPSANRGLLRASQ
jgi:hypothetical protein